MLRGADRPASLRAEGIAARRIAGHGVLHRCGGAAGEVSGVAPTCPWRTGPCQSAPVGEGPAEAKVGEVWKRREAVGGPLLLQSGTAPCSSRVMGSGAYFPRTFSHSESTLHRPAPCRPPFVEREADKERASSPSDAQKTRRKCG